MAHKLPAGDAFPAQTVSKLGGGDMTLGKPADGKDWQMVVVYRGAHCPVCTRYLGEINAKLDELNDLGIDVVAVSADPEEKAQNQTGPLGLNFPIGYNHSVEQMQELGLYISDPRSAQETDRAFSEPGLFVINDDGVIQVTDISNAPFARPDLNSLTMGLGFIRNPENDYPIRGTHD